MARAGGNVRRVLIGLVVAALLAAAGVFVWTQSSGERKLGALESASKEPLTLELEQGVPRFMLGEVPVEGTTPTDRSYAFLERHSDVYALDKPQEELEVVDVESGETLTHVHLQQKQGDIPVYGGNLVMHLDGDHVVATNGRYLAEVPDLEAEVEAESAINAARKSSGVEDAAEAKPTLTYFDADLLMTPEEREASKLDGETHLAWQVDVEGADAEGRAVARRSFVDALSGEVLFAFDLIHTHAATKRMRIFSAGGTGGDAPPRQCNYSRAVQWFDQNGVLANMTPDAEGTAASRSLHTVFDYFFDTFHRHSFNGNDGLTVLMLDVVENWLPSQNAAYWPACNLILFNNDMSTLDVLAHEFAHGVTQFAVNGGLTYAFQSGALNESVSDTFAVLIDSANWTVAEGSASTQFRDYRDPTASRQFDPPRGQPDEMPAEVFAANIDNGGVHQNSGIPNKAGYLLMAGGLHNNRYVAPLGRAKTAQLWFEVLDNWLTSSSAFADFRNSMVAASSMWAAAGTNGFTAADACRIRNAMAAVGLDPGDADCDGTPDSEETGLDADTDGDGIANAEDNCALVPNETQIDFDRDGRGSACDSDESLSPEKPILSDAIARRTEFFQRIEIPVLPCLERCEPDVPMEITLDVDIELGMRLVDEKGNVIAEGSSEKPLVFEPRNDLEYELQILPRDLELSENHPLQLELRPRP